MISGEPESTEIRAHKALEALQGVMDELGIVQAEHRSRATQCDMQSLLGLLQFVASVSPPTRIFTNRMLQDLREAPPRCSESLSLGFRRDLASAQNGVKIMDKHAFECQDVLELDACLSGCGAFVGWEYYLEEFPEEVRAERHIIAR